MNKNQTIKLIYETLMKKGTQTERGNILSVDPTETKVYTKRLQVNQTIGEIEIVYVTITSDDEDFMDASPNQVRINTKNPYDAWINIWATEADEQMLNLILTTIL